MSLIVLHIQSLPMIQQEMFASAVHWAFHIGRHTNHQIILSLAHRSSIDRGRNEAAKLALENCAEFLWFLDDDMPILPETLQSLISCEADIAMAHSYIRGYPYQPMCFYWTEGSGPDNPQGSNISYFEQDSKLYDVCNEDGVAEVAAVGFTCTLIKTDLLRKLQKPYFVTTPNGTEDVYFCLKAHFEQKDPVKIVVDTRVPTTHLGYPERINRGTVEALREYHKSYLPPEESRGDRGERYLKMIEDSLKESE